MISRLVGSFSIRSLVRMTSSATFQALGTGTLAAASLSVSQRIVMSRREATTYCVVGSPHCRNQVAKNLSLDRTPDLVTDPASAFVALNAAARASRGLTRLSREGRHPAPLREAERPGDARRGRV